MSAQIDNLLPAAWEACGDGAAAYRGAFRRACRPRKQRSPADWADADRWISSKESAKPGKWSTARTPYMRFMLDWLAPSSSSLKHILMCGTQLMKTEVILNWWGSTVVDAPGPFMLVQPTVDTGKRFSRQRVEPMIRQTPSLRERIAPKKSRDSENALREKHYPGGMLIIAGANSIADLRSTPCRYGAEDEIDIYQVELADQGTVDGLVDRRTSSYGRRRKRLRASSPTIKGASEIAAEYEQSTQGKLEVPCPLCSAWYVLSDEQITADGHYLCPECGEFFSEAQGKGYWYGVVPARMRVIEENPTHEVKGLWVPSWYSALGLGYTWTEIASMKAATATDTLAEKEYVNTIQGLPWEDTTTRLDWEKLERENWHMGEVPKGALILTAAVDLQNNRYVVTIWGWGRGEQCWLIDAIELPGKPTRPGSFEAVEAHIARPLINSRGRTVPISAVAVDTGNWTTEAYQMVRARVAQGYHAIKGDGRPGLAVIGTRPSQVDFTQSGRTIKAGVSLWRIGTEPAKKTLLARLKDDEVNAAENRMVHFPSDVSDDVLQQLTAERWDPQRRRHVKLIGRRNDYLDTFVYAYGMALSPMVGLHKMRERDWQLLDAKYEPEADLFTALEQSPKPPERERQREGRPTPQPAQPGGFIPKRRY